MWSISYHSAELAAGSIHSKCHPTNVLHSQTAFVGKGHKRWLATRDNTKTSEVHAGTPFVSRVYSTKYGFVEKSQVRVEKC